MVSQLPEMNWVSTLHFVFAQARSLTPPGSYTVSVSLTS